MPSKVFKVKYGLDVSGSIILSGTVDNVDIAAFKTNYDNHGHDFSEIANANLSDMDEKAYISLTGKPTSLADINSAEGIKLSNIEQYADVTDTANVTAAGAVMKSVFNANTLIYATTNSTPLALAVPASTIIGRSASGSIDALTSSEVRTILNVLDGADITNSTTVNNAGAVMETDFDAGTFLYATTNNTPIVKTASQVRTILNIEDGANDYDHPDHSGHVHSIADGATTIQTDVIDATMLRGDTSALNSGTSGQALIAGAVSGRFAWHGFGAAADKGVVTVIDTSADLITSNAVKVYVDNKIGGMGNIRPAVADLAALKALTNNADKDMVLVENLGLYRFDAQASDTGNDNTIVVPTAGGGRWFKMSSTINEHGNLDGIDKWGGVAENTYHVPNINSNTSNFLRGDGIWATPPGTYTHPNHTGEVTGSGVLTITANAVTNTKLTDMAQYRIKGRISTGLGDPEDLTATQVRTILNIANGANNYTHPLDGGGNQPTLTNAVVYSDIEINAAGHVTSTTTRTLTLANLGYTGSETANDYSHPNHTGDVTSIGDGAITIADGVIKEKHLQTVGGGTLSGGQEGDILYWGSGGTFQWQEAADTSIVAYTYGNSVSFQYTGLGTSTEVIDSFAKADSRSVEWFLSAQDITNSRYETLRICAIHDGTNAYYNEFGNVYLTNSPNIDFEVVITGANVELRGTGSSINNRIKGIRTTVDV